MNKIYTSILSILTISILYPVSGCMDPEAFNCSSDTSDSHPYIYLQLSGYTDDGTPTYTAWDYSCSWSVASNGELIEENFTFTQDGECGGGLCDAGSQGDISYYNPDATEDDGSCMYYQAPSSDELVFTVTPGQIHIDWSVFTPPSNATVEYYSIQRCDDSGCGWVGGGASPFMPNCSCHLTGTSVTDEYDWTDGSDVKYSFIVKYAGNTSPFMAQSDVSYIHITGGCTDESACTYNNEATYDDGSCEYIDNGACDCNGNTLDCNGECGGDAVYDECTVCGGDGPDENYDCAGNCTIDADCNGVCGGSDLIDVCGNCGGGIVDIAECTGYGCMDQTACNYNADATIDSADCTYPNDNYDCDGDCTTLIDCAGECGGSAQNDACGICGGNDSSCTGCTDPIADNYDESALYSDGSCTYLSADQFSPQSIASIALYPNPFNPSVSVYFGLRSPSEVWLDVLDASGRAIDSSYLGSYSQGEHTVKWDGSSYMSGLYIFMIRTPHGTVSKQGTMLK